MKLGFLKKYKRALLIVGGVVLLLVIGFYAVALYSVRTLLDSDSATPTANQYSEWVGLWLPEDVQNFQAYGEGWQDWLVEARFEMSSQAFAEFLERNNLRRVESETLLESNYGLEWFSSINTIEHYELGPTTNSATSTPTGFYPTVWVDTSNAGNYIVYVKANDT